MEPEKKISFGFSKISRKPTLLNKPEAKKVELVECLEGQSIKVKDVVEVIDEPLIIPIRNTKNSLIERIKEFQSKERTLLKSSSEIKDERPDSDLTIDELAERELIKDAQNRLTNTNANGNVLVLPLNADKLELIGEKEPTLQDYEKIPIQDFGTAMLRGMGWKDGLGIGKNPTKAALLNAPELRPKGLGLGASKLIKTDASKETFDKEGKPLILKKGTFAKIIAGSFKGQYGEVLGLDDEAARVIVKTAIKRDILTLNEFLVVPVTKDEYNKFSNVLNNAKLEEYEEKQHKMTNLEKSKHKNSDVELQESESKEHRNRNAGISSHYEYKKRESSNDSDRKNLEAHKNSKNEKSRSKDYSSDLSSSENEKSSKVHKRKDKRRHRDKSRSPQRRHSKHRSNSKKSSKSKYRSGSSSDSDYEKRRKDKDKYRDENKSRKCKRR